MAFDFVRPSGLWVGTATGDLLLFDTRAKLQTASTCKRAFDYAQSWLQRSAGPCLTAACHGPRVRSHAPRRQR